MSGIYIKDMEMPKERESFQITIQYNGLVFDTETGIQIAEAHEVPDHGDLIERDAIYDSFKKNPYSKDDLFMSVGLAAKTMRTVNSMFALFRKTLQDAPTIIPADHIADVGNMVDKESV